jgi:hypothetical protein
MPPALYGRDITMVFQPVNATAGKR